MFEKSLVDVVRGIRSNRKRESQFISQCIAECKEELKGTDPARKARAIQKLTYLHMLGYGMGWAAFHVVEVMSQPVFRLKRIGYLAASQSFTESTDVVLLCTNLFKKDFSSKSMYDTGLALSCLMSICTEDLARDLVADVVGMLNSARPFIRKKAVLALFKIFLKFPGALRPSFPRLREKLEDTDTSVVSCTVNVICELARKSPQSYAILAPTFFNILNTTSNNWILIKVVKLFGALTLTEPRLAKKLVAPISNILNTTVAKSLMYECIHTVTVGMTAHLSVVKLAVEKIRSFIEDPDQNLKYLGLIALGNLMKTHPKLVAEHRDVVLNCLDDEDVTIRTRSLDILIGMVNRNNITDIVRRLMDHLQMAEGQYREAIITKAIAVCSENQYALVPNFPWFISVLVEIAHIRGHGQGKLIGEQLINVAVRVVSVRPYAVRSMASLLADQQLLCDGSQDPTVFDILYAAAWIIGEFARFIENCHTALMALLQPRVEMLPGSTQSVYIQSIMKVYTAAAADVSGSSGTRGHDTKESDLLGDGFDTVPSVPTPSAPPVDPEKHQLLRDITGLLLSRMAVFRESVHMEVQERACAAMVIVNMVSELSPHEIATQMGYLFDEPLNPVAPKAQRKVPVPEGLHLNKKINDYRFDEEEEEDLFYEFGSEEESVVESDRAHAPFVRLTPGEIVKIEREKVAEKKRRTTDPFYLSNTVPTPIVPEDVDDIPMVTLTEKDLRGDERLEVRRGSRGAVARSEGVFRSAVREEIIQDSELPPGATHDSEEEEPSSEEEQERDVLAGVDVTTPLGAKDTLPEVKAYRDIEQAKQKDGSTDRRRHHRREKGEEGGERRHRRHHPRREEKTEAALIDFDTPSLESEGKRPSDYELLASGQNTPTAVTSPKSAIGEKGKAKEQEHTYRRHHHHHHRHRSEGQEKEKSEERMQQRSKKEKAAAPVPSPSSPPPPRKTLFKDANINMIYEPRPSASSNLCVAVIVKNVTTAVLSYARIQVENTLNAQLMGGERSATVELVTALEANQIASKKLEWKFSSISSPQRVKAILTYCLEGGEEVSQRITFSVPVSWFVVPTRISTTEFAALLGDSKLAIASAIAPPPKELATVVEYVARGLRLERVEDSQGGSSLFGQTLHKDPVAVLVRSREGGVTVDLKSSGQQIATSLISEVITSLQS